MGAQNTRLPVPLGEGLPDNPGEFDGWDADELLGWLDRAAPVAARYRLAVGLALCRLRDLTDEGAYGREEERVAALSGVVSRTLRRWRSAAEEHWPELAPVKAAPRKDAQKKRQAKAATLRSPRPKRGPPPLEAVATELVVPTPAGGMPLPKAEPAPPAPSSKDEQVHGIFERFFSSDPVAVAALSNLNEGKARIALARRWLDRYEMAVKGVTPYGAPVERPVVTPNWKAARK